MTDRQVSLQSARMQLAEYARQTWHIVVADGVTLDDVVKPGYWAHVSNRLKTGDHIEAISESMTFWAHLLVIDVGRVAAKVVLLGSVDIGANMESIQEPESGHIVAFKGPRLRWSIIRTSDSAVVKSNFGSREEATKALSDYLRALAA